MEILTEIKHIAAAGSGINGSGNGQKYNLLVKVEKGLKRWFIRVSVIARRVRSFWWRSNGSGLADRMTLRTFVNRAPLRHYGSKTISNDQKIPASYSTSARRGYLYWPNFGKRIRVFIRKSHYKMILHEHRNATRSKFIFS